MRTDETLARCQALRDGTQSVGDGDLDWLVECFSDPIRAVRRTAGDAVAALAVRGVDVKAVLELAMVSGEFDRRWVAAWTAARIFGPSSERVRTVLVEALGVDDGDVRWAAARVLTMEEDDDLVDRLRELGVAGNAEQRKMALYCLRDLGVSAQTTTDLFRQSLADPHAGVRMAAMNALARRGAETENARRIAGLLRDDDGGVRRAAAAVLGRLGVRDSFVIEALRACSAGDDAVLVRVAGNALERLR